jgi:proteasome lid subunit RPN8/RPN11
MPDLSIPQYILDQIVAHARELAPFECCGLLAGTNKTVTHLYRITNIVAVEGAEKLSTFDEDKVAHLERLSPEERAEIAFVMDMGDFSAAKKDIRKNGLDLQVVYHSHRHQDCHRLRRNLATYQSAGSGLSPRFTDALPRSRHSHLLDRRRSSTSRRHPYHVAVSLRRRFQPIPSPNRSATMPWRRLRLCLIQEVFLSRGSAIASRV